MTPAAAEWLRQIEARPGMSSDMIQTARSLAMLADEEGRFALEVDESGELTDRQAARLLAHAGPNRAQRRALRKARRSRW